MARISQGRARKEIAVEYVDQILAACPTATEVTIATLQDSSQVVRRLGERSPQATQEILTAMRNQGPSGAALFDQCLECDEIQWDRYTSLPTTFVVIGDGQQCDFSDQEVVRLMRDRVGPTGTLFVIGTCHDSISRTTLATFAASCGGIYAQDSTIAAIHVQLNQLIALVTKADGRGHEPVLPILLALMEATTELRVSLTSEFSELQGTLQAIQTGQNLEHAAVTASLKELRDRTESLLTQQQITRELIASLKTDRVRAADLSEFRKSVRDIATREMGLLESLREKIGASTTQAEFLLREVQEIREAGRNDTEVLRALDARIRELATVVPPAEGAFPTLGRVTWTVLGALLGSLIALLLARYFGMFATRSQIEDLRTDLQDRSNAMVAKECGSSDTQEAISAIRDSVTILKERCRHLHREARDSRALLISIQRSLDQALCRVSDQVVDVGDTQKLQQQVLRLTALCDSLEKRLALVGGCRFVPRGNGGARDPLEIEAVSVAENLSSGKQDTTGTNASVENSSELTRQQLTQLVGGDHRVVTELFGLGIDSPASLGQLDEKELAKLSRKLTNVSEEELRVWVRNAR